MPKLKDGRVCKIFFSSPFGGMEEEREELTRKYFPQLQHLCSSHGVQFAAVDMRWGITAESSEKAQVINICLREIDRSDVFVGFFGQRYGWHGAEDKILQQNFDNAVGKHPWLDQYRDKSVTELEFLHGHLNNPGQIPAAIFFRDKVYDNKMREEGLKKGDKKQIFKYSPEGELSVKLMDDLKQRVWDTRGQTLEVNMNYKTPAEAAKGMFRAIWKYLTEKLLVDLDIQSMSRWEQINLQHEAFLSSRCNIYIKNEENFALLNKHLCADLPQPMVVTGAPGSGKSALVCNWVSELRKRSRDYIIVCHFFGYAVSSTVIYTILRRLVVEFETHLRRLQGSGEEKHQEEKPTATEEADFVRDLMHKLVIALERLSSLGKTPVLVLDGLEKVSINSKIGTVLYWLPSNLPSSTIVLVSTLSSDKDTLTELMTNRHYISLEIQPIDEDRKRELCLRTLQESGKELSPPQLDRIVKAEQTQKPLFLRLILSELMSFGYFRLLDKKIDTLVSADNIADLFQHFLQRLEDDYNVADYEGNLVEQVMCSVCLSQQGLNETELQAIFNIPDHVWFPLCFALEKVIVDQAGYIKLGFTELEDAVTKRYLGNESRQHYLKVLIDYFSAELEKLNDPFKVNISSLRPVTELPWLWSKLGDKEGLAQCLSHRLVFSDMEHNNIYDLVTLWRETEYSASQITDMLLNSFDVAVVDVYNKCQNLYYEEHPTPGLCLESYLRRIDRFLDVSSFDEQRERVLHRLINVLREGLGGPVVWNKEETEYELLESRYKLACVYCDTYQTEKGIQQHEEILQIRERNFGYSGSGEGLTVEQRNALGMSQHGLGVCYLRLNKFDKALPYFKKSLELHEGTPSYLKHAGQALNNIGLCYTGKKEYETAIEYLDQAIAVVQEYNFGHQPPLVGELILNKGLCFRRMGQLDEAEELYQKSLEVKIKALGREHQFVAMGYLNLGTLENHRGNSEKALQHCCETVEIFETIEQTWNNPMYVMALENKCCFLGDLQRFREADKIFLDIFDWHEKHNSLDNCIGSLCREMTKFYIREERYEDAYKVTSALLKSSHKSHTESYLHLALILFNLGEDRVKELNVPEEFSIPNAIESFPADDNLISYWSRTHLIPNNQAEEFVRLVNRLDDLTEFKNSCYTQPAEWCVINGEVMEDCLFRLSEEGLKRYPNNPELQLNLAKSYVRQEKGHLAVPLLVTLAEREPDNFVLMMFAAQTALINGEIEIAKVLGNKMDQNFKGEEEQSKIKVYKDFLEKAESGDTRETTNDAEEEEQSAPQEHQATSDETSTVHS